LLNTQKFLEKRPVPETQAAKPETDDLFAEAEAAVPSQGAAETTPAASSAPGLDALQRKFALNKPTPVGAKTE
jgi:hypothetical protein